jgi:hypothetical protein
LYCVNDLARIGYIVSASLARRGYEIGKRDYFGKESVEIFGSLTAKYTVGLAQQMLWISGEPF